jgi:hypothetical protein
MKRIALVALFDCLAAFTAFGQDKSLDAFIEGMAASVQEAIEKSGVNAVAVVELGTPERKTGNDVGALGKYIASTLQSDLVSIQNRRFQIVDRLNLEKVLKEQELQLSGLMDEKSAPKVGNILSCDSILTGSIEKMPSLVLVNLNLISVEKGVVLGSVQKNVPLTTDVKALLGIDFENSTIMKEITPSGTDFPYYIRVKTREGYKKELYSDGKRYVQANPNEEYAIEVENRTDKAVGVALFVDGINTAFIKRETPKGAMKWILYPRQKVTIEGWQQDATTARRFVFSGKDESLAEKRGFSDEVGIISATFFNQQDSLTRGSQEAGTKAGEAFGATVKTVETRLENTPAMVFNVWYDYATGLRQRRVISD